MRDEIARDEEDKKGCECVADVDMWMDHHTMLSERDQTRRQVTEVTERDDVIKPTSGKGIINLFKFKGNSHLSM